MIARTFSARMPDGSMKQIKRYGRTVKEACAARDKAKWGYENGLLVFNNKTPVMAYFKEWLVVNHRDNKENLSRMERHFMPVLGKLRMCDILTIHCRMILSRVEGSSQSNIDKTWALLKGFLASALADGMLTKNPLADIKKPKGSKGSNKALTEDEKAALEAAIRRAMAKDKDHRNALIFAITYGCGLRPGEARALSWANIKLNNEPTLEVVGAVKKDSQIVGEPKTEAGRRVVPIPDWLATYLKQYRQECMKKYNTGLLLFPTEANKSKPINEQTYKRRWQFLVNDMERNSGAKTYRNAIIATSGTLRPNLHPYDLRHTYCTNLAEVGVDIRTAQYLMGHSDIKMTANIYTTVTDKMKREAIAKVNAAHLEVSNK